MSAPHVVFDLTKAINRDESIGKDVTPFLLAVQKQLLTHGSCTVGCSHDGESQPVVSIMQARDVVRNNLAVMVQEVAEEMNELLDSLGSLEELSDEDLERSGVKDLEELVNFLSDLRGYIKHIFDSAEPQQNPNPAKRMRFGQDDDEGVGATTNNATQPPRKEEEKKSAASSEAPQKPSEEEQGLLCEEDEYYGDDDDD